MTRAAAVALTVALTTTTTTPPPARANPIDDFNVAALLRKAKYFLGPLQLMLDRLVALERVEASLAAEDLVSELGKATLDCVNPRGPLASYANVRDVCTLNILVKSGAFCVALVPIRPRRRGERRSLRTFPGVSLRPPLAFNTHRRASTPRVPVF
jgi:hypothetical protein